MLSQSFKNNRLIVILILTIFLLSAIFPIRANASLNTPTPEPKGVTAGKIVYLPMIVNPFSPPIPSPTTTPPPNTTPIPTPTSNPTPPATHMVYYISPSGNDANSGTSEEKPWATFNHAWQYLYPGDSLILLDGTYFQSLNPNVRNGEPGNMITIRAKNDGKAIIDGQYQRIPVKLGDTWPGPIGEYFDIEGIVAENSSDSVYLIRGNNNVLRRVSGYNANTNGNDHVFLIWANNNLIEDCVAAGSGRKMIVIFAASNETGQHNTIRRCFASYREWDGRQWHDEWPWNENFEVYSGDYNILENDIAYGYFANAGFSLLSNGPTDDNIGNKILGSISLLGGSDFQGNVIDWGNIRPQPTQYSLIKDIQIPEHRSGFILWHDGIIRDNLLQDILAWGNASVGIKADAVQLSENNVVNRATIYNNGVGLAYGGIDAFHEDLSQLTINNSRIDSIKTADWTHRIYQPITGEGARLRNRYIDGALKDGSDGTPAQSLWPWPMEQRIRDELGISVTNLIAGIISNQVQPIPDTNRPFLAISSPYEPFDSVKLGQPASKLVNLKNTGSATLTIENYQFGNGSSDFAVSQGGTCPQVPITLTPSQSCTIEITFTPNDYQAQTNDLYFYSSDLAPYPSAPSVYVSGFGYSTTSAIPLPGKMEAEAFTTSAGDFEIVPTLDDGGSSKIAGITSGAWLEYPVNVAQTGQYVISARVASLQTVSNAQFSVLLDGTVIATFYPSDTGGWDTFTDVNAPSVPITMGNHSIRIELTTGSFDLNYLKLIPQ